MSRDPHPAAEFLSGAEESLWDRAVEVERYEMSEGPAYRFELDRRRFIGVALGTGLVVTIGPSRLLAQRAGGRGGAGRRERLGERLHIGADGIVTVLTGKVEVGQGSRAEVTAAAAEELGVGVGSIRVVMADTAATPDDGGTFGSRTTPATIPLVRRAAAAAREALIDLAARRWSVEAEGLTVRDGAVVDEGRGRSIPIGELAADAAGGGALERVVGGEVSVRAVSEWRVLGRPMGRVDAEAIVTGRQRYPSDVVREGMWHGAVLRPPAVGAELVSIDLAPAGEVEGAIVVRDGQFVGAAGATSDRPRRALESVSGTAVWRERAGQPSSETLFEHLRATAREAGLGERAAAGEGERVLRSEYRVAYIAHAPMETRAAAAEWTGGEVTVWTGSQVPTRVRSQVAEAFSMPAERVRVVVPDTGGGFGGKHSGEAAVEAARLARAAGRPVRLVWSREEEFALAYFRPAGLIEVEARLSGDGRIGSWNFVNFNSGGSAIETPYAIAGARSRFMRCESPLREGSYRGLAATANTFARECFMDELAEAAGADPLGFRLRHLENGRLRDVLIASAERFGWERRAGERRPGRGVGIACGTEKGSYVAACVEVEVDAAAGTIRVVEVCEAFECGAILNPSNLTAQVEGAIIQGLGGALTERVEFEGGVVRNGRFSAYRVPRFGDVPAMETVLVDRRDLPSVGAGETPIIAVAPAIAGAVWMATGRRVRSMPIGLG